MGRRADGGGGTVRLIQVPTSKKECSMKAEDMTPDLFALTSDLDLELRGCPPLHNEHVNKLLDFIWGE